MKFFDFDEVIKDNTKFVIFGIPWDYLTSIELPNSSIAPDKIRSVSNDLALTTELGFHIPEFGAVDLGNVLIEKTYVEKNLKEIRAFVSYIYEMKSDIIPIMIGGDHFCSYPVVKAVGDNFQGKSKFGVLVFDSHLDLYQEWDHDVYSHATVSHRILDLEYINNTNLLIVGTRDIDIPEMKIAEKEEISYLNAHKIIDGLDAYISTIKKFFLENNIESLYISLDIDALDPSIAPGTGYAIPGGFSYREIWKILKEIAAQFNIVGFDLVEVAPNLDLPNNITCNLAAKLIAELMSFITNKK